MQHHYFLKLSPVVACLTIIWLYLVDTTLPPSGGLINLVHLKTNTKQKCHLQSKDFTETQNNVELIWSIDNTNPKTNPK